MPVFIPQTGNTALNLVLEQLANNVVNTVSNTGNNIIIENNAIVTPNGQIVGYINRWMYVAFADSQYGGDPSPLPTNKSYYGIYNTPEVQEPTQFGNFAWTQIAGGFGTTLNLYYKTTGGRNIQWDVNTAPQNGEWRQVPNTGSGYVAIDLDSITATTVVGGADGYATFAASVYQAGVTTPVAPVGGTYQFDTNALYPPSGWSVNIPNIANTFNNVYVASYTFSSNVYNVPVIAGTWSAPVAGFRLGQNGENATSVYNFPVYIRQTATPGTPAVNTGTWDFATGTGTAPTGNPPTEIWELNPPTGTANLWVSYSTAYAVGQGLADSLNWSGPTLLAQVGTAGSDGLSIYNYPVYQANAATPVTPTGGSYNFGTRTGTPPTDWLNVPPTSGNIYISTAQAQIQGTTGTWTGSNTWSTPTRYNGANGTGGNTTVIPIVYAAKTTAPTPIGTQGYYNFATNTLTPPTAADVTWYSNIQPGWNGLTIWTSQASFVTSVPTANIANTTSWTLPQISFAPGANGAPGSRGFVPLGFVVTQVNPLTMTSAQLTAAFSSARTNVNPPIGLGYPPIAGDCAQFYWKNTNIGQADVTVVLTYNGSVWTAVYDKVISGNVVATGSITAAQMKTNDLYTLTIQSTNANTGNYQSQGFWFDSTSGNARLAGNVSIGDSLRIGNNANIGNSVRIADSAFIGNNAVIGNNLFVGNLISAGALDANTVATVNIKPFAVSDISVASNQSLFVVQQNPLANVEYSLTGGGTIPAITLNMTSQGYHLITFEIDSRFDFLVSSGNVQMGTYVTLYRQNPDGSSQQVDTGTVKALSGFTFPTGAQSLINKNFSTSIVEQVPVDGVYSYFIYIQWFKGASGVVNPSGSTIYATNRVLAIQELKR